MNERLKLPIGIQSFANLREVGSHESIRRPSLPAYPLAVFLAAGLPVGACTDNPGISRTTLADEYLVAARMSEGGLDHWQTLALIKQSFAHAFFPTVERERLLKETDRCIFDLLA